MDADKLADVLRADIRRCLDDVATEFRAYGRDETRFVQLIARMDAQPAQAAQPVGVPDGWVMVPRQDFETVFYAGFDRDTVTRAEEQIIDAARDRLEKALCASQPPAQPVAWTRQDTINDDDGRPIGMDEPRVVWGVECPDPDESWMPLYAEPISGRAVPAQPALHPATADLVRRFSVALAEKLAAAEQKYGYSDNWARPGWMDECRQHLLDHIAKGDPRDVAAYCAFLWHHGEHTSPSRTHAHWSCVKDHVLKGEES